MLNLCFHLDSMFNLAIIYRLYNIVFIAGFNNIHYYLRAMQLQYGL